MVKFQSRLRYLVRSHYFCVLDKLTFTGFTWSSQRYRKGDSFKIISPLQQGNFYATLKQTFEFVDSDGNDLVPWISVQFYEQANNDDENILVSTGEALLPLGHGYEYVLRVHIYNDEQNVPVLNTFYSPDYVLSMNDNK